MTNDEAIKAIEAVRNVILKDPSWLKSFVDKVNEACDMAIDALKKQIPMKPIRIDKNKEFDGNWKKVCPSCRSVLIERITTDEKSYPRLYNYTPHCKCGQAIDWEG